MKFIIWILSVVLTFMAIFIPLSFNPDKLYSSDKAVLTEAEVMEVVQSFRSDRVMNFSVRSVKGIYIVSYAVNQSEPIPFADKVQNDFGLRNCLSVAGTAGITAVLALFFWGGSKPE